MATTVYLPDETEGSLLDVKHAMERERRKGLSWHAVVDELIKFYNNHGCGDELG